VPGGDKLGWRHAHRTGTSPGAPGRRVASPDVGSDHSGDLPDPADPTDPTEPTEPPELPVSAAGGWLDRRRPVVRNALGVGAAVGTYGVSFGALATTSGLTPVQACALSVLAFTGGSQFALIGVLGGGGSAASGVTSAVLLGSRNAFYGLRLAPVLKVRGLRRLPAAHLVIDETTAMTISQDDERAARLAFWATGLFIFTIWNLATLLGAVGASVFSDPKKLGLDAAVGAAFLALLWPRLQGRIAWTTAVASAVIALALVPVLTPGLPVLVAGLATVAVMVPVSLRTDP
jgi:predicted branched-subunit amino acid permease